MDIAPTNSEDYATNLRRRLHRANDNSDGTIVFRDLFHKVIHVYQSSRGHLRIHVFDKVSQRTLLDKRCLRFISKGNFKNKLDFAVNYTTDPNSVIYEALIKCGCQFRFDEGIIFLENCK